MIVKQLHFGVSSTSWCIIGNIYEFYTRLVTIFHYLYISSNLIDIPKSGGTTVKQIYKCMRLAMTVRVGVEPHLGHDKDEELVVFETRGEMLTLNVDTISPAGMLRAKKMGLVESGLADLIVTTNINVAVATLYDDQNRGRLLALFRPPVDRMISKFYYSQVATWERSYHPQWQNSKYTLLSVCT